MLTQHLPDLKKKTMSYVVHLTKVERMAETWVIEVVLQQPVIGDIMVLDDVALMLYPSSPREKLRDKLRRLIYYGLMKQLDHIVFHHVNIRT
jgi:hypothetical protein